MELLTRYQVGPGQGMRHAVGCRWQCGLEDSSRARISLACSRRNAATVRSGGHGDEGLRPAGTWLAAGLDGEGPVGGERCAQQMPGRRLSAGRHDAFLMKDRIEDTITPDGVTGMVPDLMPPGPRPLAGCRPEPTTIGHEQTAHPYRHPLRAAGQSLHRNWTRSHSPSEGH